jgi:hypothetical protein
MFNLVDQNYDLHNYLDGSSVCMTTLQGVWLPQLSVLDASTLLVRVKVMGGLSSPNRRKEPTGVFYLLVTKVLELRAIQRLKVPRS